MKNSKNKLIIAAAGSGKTTHIIKEALEYKSDKILITTFTQANEDSIKQKFVKINKCIPDNVTIKTWFSLLIEHGVKPYQGSLFDKKINGMILVNERSGLRYIIKTGQKVYFSEKDFFEQHYFNKKTEVYSDKLAKLVIRCNESSDNAVMNRLCKVFKHIYIDEAQDLAGYDLEIVKLLFKSNINVTLVADPRQTTYLTHHEAKYDKYKYGLLKEFVLNECKKIQCEIDETTLNYSHRNIQAICDFSSKLYPQYISCNSKNDTTCDHEGIIFVKVSDVDSYLEQYKSIQLRYNVSSKYVNSNFPAMNFGVSKGLEFNHVLLFPTADMIKWISNNEYQLESKTRAQFYVGLTRAFYSVGIVLKKIPVNFDESIKTYIVDT